MEVGVDKIGDPAGAGEIEILFGAKVVGDGGDVLPGLGGNIAGGGMQAIFAKLRQRGGNQLASGLFTFCGRRSRIQGGSEN